ncbi:uncharacterized protein [Haliotis asinina]|uniref:uncharacterized protein n=1 Tax=Haliotis asinina TaxID=109174 RepID=UPI0035321660
MMTRSCKGSAGQAGRQQRTRAGRQTRSRREDCPSSATSPRTRMATKRTQLTLKSGTPEKRQKGDADLLTEHELSGRPNSKWCRLGLPSCNTYRGSVYEVGRTFSEFIKDIAAGNITSCPEEYVQSLREREPGLVNNIDKLIDRRGFAFYSSNTPLCLNLTEAEPTPSGVVCDVIMLSHTNLPLVITVTDGHHDVSDVKKYNASIVRELTYAMRDFTDEGFNLFDATLDIKNISKDCLKNVLKNVSLEYKRNFPIERLCMSRDRCLALTKALLAQGFKSSVDHTMETQIKRVNLPVSPRAMSPERRRAVLEPVYLLTPDQFCLLNRCINSSEEWLVSSKPGTGKIRFALETAQRLSLQGQTLVLCESDEFRRKIKYIRNLRVITRPELQANPAVCHEYVNFVVVKAEQLEFQCGKELIFDWHHYLEHAIQSRGGKLVIVYDKRDEEDIEEQEANALERHRERLKKCMIPDDIVLELLSKKVLGIADLIWIKKRPNKEGQNEELVNSLRRTSRRGYDIFLRALRKTRQGHLAELLENNDDSTPILMSPEHLELLQSAREDLLQSMIPFGVLAFLFKKGVFTRCDVSRIQAKDSINPINEMLLEYLYGKADTSFDYLLKALQHTGQNHLKDLLLKGNSAAQYVPQEDELFISHAKNILADKVNLEELLQELTCSNHLHKNDLGYIMPGNYIMAYPEDITSAESKEEESTRKVVDRLFELLARKRTHLYDALMGSLRRTGQYEAVQLLQLQQGQSASNHMDTEDASSSYRPLDVKFIETKAFQAVRERLKDPTEVFIILTGAPGEGKTTAALEAMRHQAFYKRRLVIKSPDEFNKEVDLDTPTIVVLDDVFGIVEVCEKTVREWVPVLRRIKKHSESMPGPGIKVIITSRNHVWRAADSMGHLSDIIPVSSNIDLTVLVPLVRAEKKKMLDSHLDKFGIHLDSTEVDKIADTDATLGFPLCCKLFAAERMFQDNPVHFFTNPLSYIIKRLVSSCEDPSNMTLIKQVVMSKGQLDRKKLEGEAIDERSVANMKNYVFQEGSILYFPHKSIADAASYVMATKFSIDYLGEYSLQFLYERVRETPAKGMSSDTDIQIHVNQNDLKTLIQRLGTEMAAGNLALACSHPALMTASSVKNLFKQLRDFKKTVQLKDQKHGGSFLYWTTWNNSENLCKGALEKTMFPELDLCEAVLGCCLSGNKNALRELLKKTDISTVRSSGIKSLPKLSTRQQLVANESVRVIEISGQRMAHLACKYGHTDIVKILMDNGLDLNERDDNGETCLLAACMGDNPAAVSFLLENNAHWSKDNDDHNPLHHAIEKEKVDMLRLLLECEEAKEFLNKPDKDSQSPLHLACLKKSPEMVELLLEKNADVNVTDSCGWTPLHYISWVGNRKIIDILIKFKADVNAQCKESSLKPKSPLKLKSGKKPNETEGMTALHLACHQGHVGVVKKLMDVDNIDINISDVFGKSALYIASKRGRSQVVKILLEKRADTSLATTDCRTAVYAASKKGHAPVIELLCKSGAGVNTGTKGQRKRNPLSAASRKGYVAAVDCLLRYGADVNLKDSEGNTSLHIASAAGQTDVVKCLLKWGADVLARNSSEQTPLHDAVAVTNTDPDTIDYLLLAGADVNAVDDKKWTPLHLASLCSTAMVVKTLLLWKADVHSKDISNMTALRYASAVGKVGNISVLLQHGATIDSVCLNLAVIYGHANAVEVLLKEKFPIKNVDEMYDLAKQQGFDKVMDVINRYRPDGSEKH